MINAITDTWVLMMRALREALRQPAIELGNMNFTAPSAFCGPGF